MLLYAHKITPRLRYITAFAGELLFNQPFSLTDDQEAFQSHSGARINYSDTRLSIRNVWIRPSGLLVETGIREQDIACFSYQRNKAFFPTEGDFPFDVFSASFYLLSRYEEYLPHNKDSYGRYAHENALAFREAFLRQPLINLWMQELLALLRQQFPDLTPATATFRFLPTYDIDMAWSCRHKGFGRNVAGLAGSLLRGAWQAAGEKIQALSGRIPDPYDAYERMDQMHESCSINPLYFFLVAERRGRFDKNLSPRKPAVAALIRRHADRYDIGLHPSWKSGDESGLILKEKRLLETLTGETVAASRQHYIRFTLPGTFRELIQAGISRDYSMGYGSINGFRASVASPFYWYDLEAEEQTSLLLYPFCFMEANSYYEQEYTAAQALEELRYYAQVVAAVKGTMVTVWHNSSLGTSRRFAGWWEIYSTFVREVSGKTIT